jgi:hypothetical protein
MAMAGLFYLLVGGRVLFEQMKMKEASEPVSVIQSESRNIEVHPPSSGE